MIPAFQSNFPSACLSPSIGIKCITSVGEGREGGKEGVGKGEKRRKNTLTAREKREEGECEAKGGEEEVRDRCIRVTHTRGKSENIRSEKPWCSRTWAL